MELANQTQAAANRIALTDGGLVDDGLHGGEFLGGVQLLENFKDVADTKEPVSVGKHFGLIRREVRGKRTLRGALPPLVLAGSACLASPTFKGHVSACTSQLWKAGGLGGFLLKFLTEKSRWEKSEMVLRISAELEGEG